MRNQAMPYHCLKRLGMGRHARSFDCRHHHNTVADLFRVAPIATNDTEHLEAALLCLLETRDYVGTDIFLRISPANGEYENRIIGIGRARTR